MEIGNLAADKDYRGHHHDDHLNAEQHFHGNHDENIHEHHHDGGRKDERMIVLTGAGPKAELLASNGTMSTDGHGVFQDNIGVLRQSEVERNVRNVLHTNFGEASFPRLVPVISYL